MLTHMAFVSHCTYAIILCLLYLLYYAILVVFTAPWKSSGLHRKQVAKSSLLAP